MFAKITAFFMSVILFFAELLGFPVMTNENFTYYNLSYGEHERHTIDLCIPKNTRQTGLVLYIHGGGWYTGDKEIYRDTIKEISGKFGVACAAMNYRYVCDTVDINDIMDDVDAAMVRIKETGKKHGVDISRSILTGGSAGANLSLLYAYSRVEGSAIPPVAVMSDCGPTDLTDDYYYYNPELGKENALGNEEFISQLLSWACGTNVTYETRDEAAEAIKKISPLYYANEFTVPTIINHGIKDDIVPFRNAVELDKKLTECGVEHYFNIYPDSDHGLAHNPDCREISMQQFYAFIEKYL